MNVPNYCTNARLTRIHDPYVSCMCSSHISPDPVSCYFYMVIRIMFLGSCRCIYYILGHTRRHDVYSRTSYCNIPPHAHILASDGQVTYTTRPASLLFLHILFDTGSM